MGLSVDMVSDFGRTRAWASLRIRDLYNDVGKFRSSIYSAARMGIILVIRRAL